MSNDAYSDVFGHPHAIVPSDLYVVFKSTRMIPLVERRRASGHYRLHLNPRNVGEDLLFNILR